jgi:hypothetical protein
LLVKLNEHVVTLQDDHSMNHCKACRIFLYDYLNEHITKNGVLYSVSNSHKIQEKIYELIDTVLRVAPTVTEYVLKNAKGEYEMRTTLIQKPDTKDKENLLRFYILKSVGPGFRNQIPAVTEFMEACDFVKFRRSGRIYNQTDQFLSNLFIPLFDILIDMHKEHTGQQLPKAYIETPPKLPSAPKQIVVCDDDDLYT